MVKTIRVGNGCGFWGDNLDAPVLLAQQGKLDYLTLEYLAELTMSILALQKQRSSDRGFAHDFLKVLEQLTPILRDQPNLKIITNAGGMNADACARGAKRILNEAGLGGRNVAVVEGDDLMPRLDALREQGHELNHLDSGKSLDDIRDRVVSANAYLGMAPIVTALSQGASIVITGRVTDAALTVAPLAHEHGWKEDDWDKLCAGTVAGHLIECGAQVTGGLWCNWSPETNLANIGYPIAEVDQDGSMIITKPEGTGGAVNFETVAEQLLYEVGDPAAYMTPDVIADFTTIQVEDQGNDSVAIRGARGIPAPDSYKVSIAYRDGFMSSGSLLIYGPDAPAKAQHCGEMILQRLERVGMKPQQSNIELLGTGEAAPVASQDRITPPEVMLRVTCRDERKEVIERFTRELAPLVTSGPPGVAGYASGRPPVREVFAFWPALISKDALQPTVRIIEGVQS